LIFQALQTLSAKSSSPASDAVWRAVQPRRDIDVLPPLGGVEHDPRALHHPEGQRHRRRAPLKLNTLVLRQLNLIPTGPGHISRFAAPRQAPFHKPQNLRTRPLVPHDGGVALFNAASVPIIRYRYRGAKIATPWTQRTMTTRARG
jgi:hypothetical protein